MLIVCNHEGDKLKLIITVNMSKDYVQVINTKYETLAISVI